MKSIVFGITGGIACGKSNVTKNFRALGVPILDADLLARELVEPGQPYLTRLIEIFGSEFLDDSGRLRRKELGNLIFSQPEKRQILDNLMFEGLFNLTQLKILELVQQGHPLIGYDAALIIEMNLQDQYRPLIVVSCPRDLQKSRLMARNGLTEEQALQRINSQFPLEKKLKYADHVIDTTGSLETTAWQVSQIYGKLKELLDES